MLIVSLHDVTPALEESVRRGWDLCTRRGLRPSLFVVPQWHGAWPLEEAPAFVEWLRERQDEGAEILLHGERHDEVGQRRSWLGHLRACGRTASEAEFLMLGRTEARARIARGIERLRALGLPPLGFAPPAWLAREATWEAARQLDLGLAEDDRAIRLLHGGGRLASPVIRWSARSLPRALASVLVAEARCLAQRHRPLLRLALHPPDVSRPLVTASVARTLDRLRRARRAVSYAEACSALRASIAAASPGGIAPRVPTTPCP
jgi:predicted deacetylase